MDFYAIFGLIGQVLVNIISWISYPVFGGFSILEILFSLTVVFVVFRLLIAPFVGASIEERRPHTESERLRGRRVYFK